LKLLENDCSIEIRCHLDCSNRGKCKSDGKCACYPGYTGQDCELFIPCPSNCTAAQNGICRADSTCLCFEGFKGPACESSNSDYTLESSGNNTNNTNQSSGMVGCKNNCTNRGICNKLLGVCICESGYFGNNCEKDEKELLNETNETSMGEGNHTGKNQSESNETKTIGENAGKENEEKTKIETQEASNNNTNGSTNSSTKNLAQKNSKLSITMIKQNMTSLNETSTAKNGTNVTSNESISNNTNSNVSINLSNTTKVNASNGSNASHVFEYNKTGNRSLTAQMFGLADEITAVVLSSVVDNSETYDVHKCDNDCNYNGLCVNKVCFCRQGFHFFFKFEIK